MPAIPAPTLAKYRNTPHSTKLYMVVQQSQWRTAGLYSAWDGYIWSGTITAVPSNPDTEFTVTSDNGIALLDGMTVFIDSTELGGKDRGTFRIHGDQTIGAGAETLYIHESSELGSIQIGDLVVVVDEFRLWSRYPKITEAGGNLTFYKDFGYFRDSLAANGLLWSQLGGSDALRRQALYPSVPIMGTHRVHFLPVSGTVDIDFDWSASYAMHPSGTVNAWVANGENGLGGWSDNVQNPAAQTYSQLSGLAGYRTTLEVASNVQDPIIEYRRGVRYVFMLRRPEDYQDGVDPLPKSHYTPITNFEIGAMQGDFASGSWRTSARIYSTSASEYEISAGALVIIFSEDYYDGTQEELGPIPGSENIVMVGHIANGTVTQDSETGDTTFDIISLAEQASKREAYPVPIENDDAADEWIKGPDLTVSLASWWFLIWHSNMAQVADVFAQLTLDGADDTREIEAQDFLSGDIFRSSVDSFLQDRVVGRILIDRYERVRLIINRQVQTSAGADTLFSLQDGDWIRDVSLREVNESPVNLVEAGGVNWNAGTITPFLSIAPGFVSGYIGTSTSASNSLAVSGQAQLNTISGRLYAWRKTRYPQLTLNMAGNWRHGDIVPQQYVNVTLTTDRVTLTGELFLLRGVTYNYDALSGTLLTTFSLEIETDGPDGVTVPILSELPTTTGEMNTPPEKPPSFGGRALAATGDGVWYTENLFDATPTWTGLNDGLDDTLYSLARIVNALVEDPNNPGEWWAGTEEGIFYNDDLFGGGTWEQLLTIADIDGIATVNAFNCSGISFCALLPGYVVAVGDIGAPVTDLWVIDNKGNGASSDVADWRGRGIGADQLTGQQAVAVSKHLDVGNTEPRCVIIGIQNQGILFIEDTQDTSGAWTNYTMGATVAVHPVTFWKTPTFDDDDGVLTLSNDNGGAVYDLKLVTTFLDAGVPVTTSVGDAGMAPTTLSTTGVIMWADVEGEKYYCADDVSIWYSLDEGTTWQTYGNAYAAADQDPDSADGNENDGFIIGFSVPAAGISVEFNNTDGSWEDKTGNLVALNTIKIPRIYLLDT